MKITVRYSSIDHYHKSRSFKTLEGARKFAHHWVGEGPEIGIGYAVSGDGIGKITVSGCSLYDLFPKCLAPETPDSYDSTEEDAL